MGTMVLKPSRALLPVPSLVLDGIKMESILMHMAPLVEKIAHTKYTIIDVHVIRG